MKPEHALQPESIDFHTADDVFIKRYFIVQESTLIPQHSHQYDHNSMIATGAVKAWRDGVEIGDFTAPACLFIQAGCKHTFLTLAPNTTIYCIHNVFRTGEIEVAEEHHLGE